MSDSCRTPFPIPTPRCGQVTLRVYSGKFNPLNAELNPIWNLLTSLGAHPILHVGTIRVKTVKGRFTHSMPRPCRAAKGLECVFPIWFTQCGRVWLTLAVPCPCHAPTITFFSRPRHSTSVERWPVGYLPAFGFFRLPGGVPRRLLSEAYQSQMQEASVKPNNVCHGRGKEW